MGGVSMSAVLNVIGGIPQVGNDVSVFVKGKIVTVQKAVTGVTKFVSGVTNFLKNPLGAIMSEVQGVVESAVGDLVEMSGLKDIAGNLITEATSLVDSIQTGFNGAIGTLTSLTDSIAGLTVPSTGAESLLLSALDGDEPVPESFGLVDVLSVTETLHQIFTDGIPPELGLDLDAITAPLDMEDEIATYRAYIANASTLIASEIENGVPPATAALAVQEQIETFTAKITTKVNRSKAAFAKASRVIDDIASASMLSAALNEGSAAGAAIAKKIVTPAGRQVLTV